MFFCNSLRCALITVGHHDALKHSKSDIKTNIKRFRLKDGNIVGEYQETQLGETLNEEQVLSNETIKTVARPSTYNYIFIYIIECGSCYGALPAGRCCNTCDDVKKAYQTKGWQFYPRGMEQCSSATFKEEYESQKGEGCNIGGVVYVSKVYIQYL